MSILFLRYGICAETTTASLPPIFIPKKEILKDGQNVVVKGRWKSREGEDFVLMPKVNIVNIVCDKNLMVCTETIARLSSMEENEFLKERNVNMLTMGTIPFKIIEWTDDGLVATYNAPVANVEIKISTKDNYAERSHRETSARGVETTDPENFVHWILE